MSPLVIANIVLTVVVVLYAVGLFFYLLKTRYKFVQLGKKVEFDESVKERVRYLMVNVLGQNKLLKDPKSGLIHVMFFYGFLMVQLGAIDLIWKGLAPGSHLPLGIFYSVFTFFQELVVLMILVAVVWAFYRRYIEKLVRLKRGWKNGLVLIFIGGLMVSTLLANGMGIIWHGEELTYTEPVASGIAAIFSFLPASAAAVVFYVMWWAHLLILLTFLVYVPQSKHFHLIVSPINVYMNRLDRTGTLTPIDFEALENAEDEEDIPAIGVGRIQDFTQKQMLDLYSCVECGRCTNMCPASGTGKMLSPMDLIVKLRDHLTFTGAVVTKQKPWVPYQFFANTKGNQLAMAAGAEGAVIEDIYSPSLIGEVITEEEIWACTTCRNCEDQCPVMNEHVDKIIDLRRYLTMTEGKVNPDAQRAMTNIERQGNPWGLNRKEKENWRDLDPTIHIPTVKELKKSGEEMEYLFWVGSMGAFDNRSQKIALAFCRLLNEAGVKFAILGNKEKNSGDTPRRLGNEFLFQELATANIDEFEKNDVKKIVTIDPHAYNIFKNEYQDFGWKGEVYHHTELLNQLIDENRLALNYEVHETIVFHDSCYLGRYNDVYDAPREILRGIPGVKLVEMERNRETAMCCGAGGGLMWMEEHVGNRINVARTEQALATDASVISSGCPYCLTMLEDGTKAKEVEDSIGTFDVAELLERSVFGEKVKAVEESVEEAADVMVEEVVASVDTVEQDKNTEANAEK
ncbi:MULTISPECIES: heterodisulfide reductase-related iron-sulfur binding cluster [unclassified Lysinibacillus]|uniref:heterodisulfide reductase-related iron-sulfur binding cluster n=1 Tax=unclassified Lysinibacillus TaxID=2636778 RepID=UPI002011935D|nr:MULTISPECIES: heterodisulfide reductase-related iron-sulfur binding cluster [unclassified Lysinibacillus]MCL1697529.1 (Fe-S)-binding protein [Lysinibacillus sp. BPa_S21]MCL1699821.1 (Fe-S)-binding protein [Lysinibacillus sp. Bpr_S20]